MEQNSLEGLLVVMSGKLPTDEYAKQLASMIRAEYTKDIVPDDSHLYLAVEGCLVDAGFPDDLTASVLKELRIPKSFIQYIEEKGERAVVIAITKEDSYEFLDIPSGKNEWGIVGRTGHRFQYPAFTFLSKSITTSYPRPLGK